MTDLFRGTSGNDTYNPGDVDSDGDNRLDRDPVTNLAPFNDVVSLFGGNDSLNSGQGNDIVYGGDGQDSLSGGDGNDTLFGEADRDTLIGGDGADVLYGGEGDADSLVGNDGNDTLFGGAGNNDTLSGFKGNDVLYGGDGNGDRLGGFSGDDVLYGGDGNLDFLRGDRGNDILYGGNGDGDTLQGGADDDVLYGDAGEDSLAGGVGNDILFGGADDDLLIEQFGSGNNTLYGGDGDDTFRLNSPANSGLIRIADWDFNETLTMGGISSFTRNYDEETETTRFTFGDASDTRVLELVGAGAEFLNTNLNDSGFLTITSPVQEVEANNDSATVNEDSTTNVNVLNNDTGSGDLTVTILSGPSNGTATVNSDGTIRYSADANYFGTDEIEYSLRDTFGGESRATLSLSVSAQNDAPNVAQATETTGEGEAIEFDLADFVSDVDDDFDDLTFSATSEQGSVSLSGDTLTFTPEDGFLGEASISVTATDDSGASSTNTFVVNVSDDPDAGDPADPDDNGDDDDDDFGGLGFLLLAALLGMGAYATSYYYGIG